MTTEQFPREYWEDQHEFRGGVIAAAFWLAIGVAIGFAIAAF
jgi:hypothetical protein